MPSLPSLALKNSISTATFSLRRTNFIQIFLSFEIEIKFRQILILFFDFIFKIFFFLFFLLRFFGTTLCCYFSFVLATLCIFFFFLLFADFRFHYVHFVQGILCFLFLFLLNSLYFVHISKVTNAHGYVGGGGI